MKNKLFMLMVAGALALGCSPGERNDMADKADQAGQSAKKEMTKAGKAMDEGMSTTRIKSALMASKKVDASNINVDTEKKTVFLRGSVKTAEQKKLARELANTMIDTDQKLVDELKISANPDTK